MAYVISWLFVTVGLFLLALFLALFAGTRTFLAARATVRDEARRYSRTEALQREWQAAREAVAHGGDTRKWDAKVNAINANYNERFEAEGLTAPNFANADPIGNRTALRVLQVVLEDNGPSLLLLLASPVIATSASIVALFPGWMLPLQ